MNELAVKIKKLDDKAVIPKYAKLGDAGLDITAVSKTFDNKGNVCYGSGLAFEIPQGYVGLLFPRSSNAKTDLMLTNHVGVIDSGYRGEVSFKYARVGKNGEHWNPDQEYEIGDRVGQLIIMPYPQVIFSVVKELSETERGEGGYGSTN